MRRLLTAACLVLLAGTVMAGQNIRIGVSMDIFDSPFWVANSIAIKEEAKKLGVEAIEVVADGDSNKQMQQIENFIAQKVDAIICAPHDTRAIVAAIKKANAAGIPFITNNRAAAPGAEVALNAGTGNYELSLKVGEAFAKHARDNNVKLKILEIIGDFRDENATLRHNGFNDGLKSAGDLCEVVVEVPCEWKAELALAGTVNAFSARPDINAVFCPSDGMFPAVAAGMRQQNVWFKRGEPGHVLAATLDGAREGLDGIKDGYIDMQAVQDTLETGRECVRAAVKLAKGGKLDSNQWVDPGYIVTPENFDELAPKTWGYVVNE